LYCEAHAVRRLRLVAPVLLSIVSMCPTPAVVVSYILYDSRRTVSITDGGRGLSVPGEGLEALVGAVDVGPHGRLGPFRVAPLQRVDQRRMLGAGLAGHLAVEAQAENVQVGVQPRQRIAHQQVAAAAGNQV